MDSSEVNLKEMNDRLLSILKCPTCSDYIVPPIAMCSEGHTFCETCSSKLSSCSTCKAQFTGRNYSMEKVAGLVMYPCQYASAGCDVKLRVKDKKKQEHDCLFRSFQCLFTDCRLKLSRPDYLHHLKNTHLDRLIVGTDHVVRFSTRNGSESEWVYSAFDHFFRVKFSANRDTWHWTVIYEGSCDEAKKFDFTFTMRDTTHPYGGMDQYSSTPIGLRDYMEVYKPPIIVVIGLRIRADTMPLPVEIKIHKIP